MIKENIIYKALSPLSHNGDETLSTTAPFRRQTVLFNDEIIEIPVISGNSIRGIWRRIGAKYLLEKLGIKEEEITAELYHKLFTGGSLNSSVDHAQITYRREVRKLIPFLSIFGSALDSFILKGKIVSSFLYPVSAETEQFTGIKSEKEIYGCLGIEFYTRRDDYEEKKDKIIEKSDQMKYEGEVIIPGTELSQLIILDSHHENEIGCFMQIIKDFSEKPIIGGVSRAGHGQVSISLDYKCYEKEIEAYNNFLTENKEEIKELLLKL